MNVPTVTLYDGSTARLGRIRPAAAFDAGDFRVTVLENGEKHVTPRLGAHWSPESMLTMPPASTDYATKAEASIAQVLRNDVKGCCVISGQGHSLGVWSGNQTGTPVLISDAEIDNAYRTICGPGDNGCNITTVLLWFKLRGLTFGGKTHKIDGAVACDWTNKLMSQVAIYEFAGCDMGINLPKAWHESPPDVPWDVTSSPIVGGHDVTAVDFNDEGVIISTWGGLRTMTWAAFMSRTWVEEFYALLSPDWYGSASLAPNGINAATLKADLAKLGGGTIPDVPTPVVPPVPPVVPPAGTGPTLAQAEAAVVAACNAYAAKCDPAYAAYALGAVPWVNQSLAQLYP